MSLEMQIGMLLSRIWSLVALCRSMRSLTLRAYHAYLILTNMDDADKELLLKNATDIGEVETLLDPQEAQTKRSRRRISMALAVVVWLITFVLAAYSDISTFAVNNQSARGEVLLISFVGLLMVLFSNETIASYTGFPIFYSWIPINRPTPLVLLRLVGWVFLLGAAIALVVF